MQREIRLTVVDLQQRKTFGDIMIGRLEMRLKGSVHGSRETCCFSCQVPAEAVCHKALCDLGLGGRKLFQELVLAGAVNALPVHTIRQRKRKQ